MKEQRYGPGASPMDNTLILGKKKTKDEIITDLEASRDGWKEAAEGSRDRADNWYLINWIHSKYGIEDMAQCLTDLLNQPGRNTQKDTK